RNLFGHRCRTCRIVGKMAEDILNASVRRHIDQRGAETRGYGKIVGRVLGLRSGVTNRSALHEDDRLLTITSNRGCRQAQYEPCFGMPQYGVEGDGADMVTLIDD